MNTPKEIVEYVRKIAPNRLNFEIAELVNAKFGTNFTYLKIRQLKNYWKISSNKPGQFKKGYAPFNKGRKQAEYTSPEGIERSKKTRFQPGHVPKQHLPVGSERIHRVKDDLIYVKIAEPNVWKNKAVWIWEQANKKECPKGSVVTFLDGNRRNFDIKNLYCVKRKVQLLKNSMVHTTSENSEITKNDFLRAELYSKIKEKQKEKTNES